MNNNSQGRFYTLEDPSVAKFNKASMFFAVISY